MSGRSIFAPLSMLLVLGAIGAPLAHASELAYSCGDGVCTVDPDNPLVHADLTESSSSTRADPAWSPDGTKIAFDDSEPGAYADVYVISPADPATVIDISNDPERIDIEPSWSADGSELAWQSVNSVPGKDNGNIDFAASSGTSTPQKIEPALQGGARPVWSPTGSEFAFGRSNTVYLAAPLSSPTAHVLAGGVGLSPEWSPDGTKIAAVNANPGSNEGTVRIIDADGSGVYSEMPVHGIFYATVSWSPDSSQIAYVDREGVNHESELRVAPTDPPGPGFTIPLGSDVRVPQEPVWSPDGTQIAFFAEDTLLQYDEIYVVSASGGTPRLVTETLEQNIEPAWKPEPGALPGGGSGSGGGSGEGSSGGASAGTSAGGSSGASGGSSSGSSGSGAHPPATHPPVVLKTTVFRRPSILHGALYGAYVPCNLGPTTNPVCHAYGEATYDSPITHSLDRARSTKKPPLFAKGSIKVPNGKSKALPLKLTGPAKKSLTPGKTLKLTVTIVETGPGAKSRTTTRTISVKAPGSRH